jgi:hypothetical protein
MKIVFILLLVLSASLLVQAQTKPAATKPLAANASQAVKSSPAYAEVLLRKTEIYAELEELLIRYTEEFPRVKELRLEQDLLQNEMKRLLTVNASESSKLTLALGKLMVRKAELETNLRQLQKQHTDTHPDVQRAKRKVEIFEQGIKEILP